MNLAGHGWSSEFRDSDRAPARAGQALRADWPVAGG